MQLDWTFLLFSLTVAAFCVPLLPALIELRRKDMGVLAIDRHDDGSAVYSALRALRSHHTTPIAGNLYIKPQRELDTAACTGDLHVGSGVLLNAARAQHIYLAPNAVVRNVASATHTLCVQPGCQFHWLDAPTIQFTAVGDDSLPALNASKNTERLPAPSQDTVQQKFIRIEGNWEPTRGKTLHGDYVITADVDLPPDCTVLGGIKAYGNVKLGANSFVQGSVFAQGSVELSAGTHVGGVVSANQQVLLQRGSVVGWVSQLSSVSAPSIVTHVGARVHGSVRARTYGLSSA
jgi:hypothetical protein